MDAKQVLTSLNIYLMSSTKLQHCRQEHRYASTVTCCRTNGNKKISLKNKNLSDIFLTCIYFIYSRNIFLYDSIQFPLLTVFRFLS